MFYHSCSTIVIKTILHHSNQVDYSPAFQEDGIKGCVWIFFPERQRSAVLQIFVVVVEELSDQGQPLF